MNALEDARLAMAKAARLVVREAVGMTPEDVARIEVFLERGLNPHLADLNFDSLAEIGLCMHLERVTGIVIDPSLAYRATSRCRHHPVRS